ncbi:MAG: endonuclease domain-containing protein [Casimicrobiaceae bacterium]
MRGTSRARELRQAQTDAEAKLWWYLRDRRLAGHKFRRQYPFGRYVVDFVCIERRLIVELDGGQHVVRAEHDDRRTAFLSAIGYTVLRYWGDDTLLRTDGVLEDILMHLALADSASPHPNPLPACGEREAPGERMSESAAITSPSPRKRGEGWGEGPDPSPSSPSPRLRGEGRGEGPDPSASPGTRGEGPGEGPGEPAT